MDDSSCCLEEKKGIVVVVFYFKRMEKESSDMIDYISFLSGPSVRGHIIKHFSTGCFLMYFLL